MSETTLGPPRRALIADDDPVVRMLAARALEALGFRVEEVEDGDSALRSIDRERPDIVILDVEMPGMDGFETCRTLRLREAGGEIPVLIATGLTDAETIDRAFQAGATDFIKKPIDWQLLQHRVRFLMRAHGAFQELRHTLLDLSSSQDRLANAQRIAKLGNWEWTPGNSQMLWSDEVYRVLGVEERTEGATLEAFLSVVHPDDRNLLEKAMLDSASERKAWALDHRIVRPGGEQRVVRQQAEVVDGLPGTAEHVSGTIQDVTDRKRAEEQIVQLAYYDDLTTLPNRRMLEEKLSHALERARRREEPSALLILNLDRFKRINDTLGYGHGDDVLKAVANRLVTCLRAPDVRPRAEATLPISRVGGDTLPISRVGGDEFAVVLTVIRSSEDAAHVARRILEAMRRPFLLSGQELVMSASIGIAVHPGDGEDAETLIRNANTAMHHAKEAGREIYQFFSSSMNERAMRNLNLENRLRGAADRGELSLHYQPQRDARSGRIVGVEALLRWPSWEFGTVNPSEFIPLAEEVGLIESLGEWALREACAQCRRWRDEGVTEPRVAVNVSSRQLRRADLPETVARALSEFDVPPTDLELEITESALLGDEPEILEILESLKRLGVRVALDDFGTGYSSLSHLARFPIDTLKIDRSFVREIGRESQSGAIIAAVVAMAHRLGLEVVAEGVETAEQEAFLRDEGCDALQGYRVGRPVDGRAALDSPTRTCCNPAS
jgi:PAS domain S-box-containing protein